MAKLEFIDLFCGAGGFTEGLRLAGLKPVLGMDNWNPAIRTYTANLTTEARNVNLLELSDSISAIDSLPNTSVIVGSPPCVSFSKSNLGGFADKSLGLDLIKSFFRIVAVKLHRPGSELKAWVMENVPSVGEHLPPNLNFFDLGLEAWAERVGLNPNQSAIQLQGRQHLMHAHEFGVAQKRSRLFLVEVMGMPINFEFQPTAGHTLTLGKALSSLPSPNKKPNRKFVIDPHYRNLRIHCAQLTDHFYDTGLPLRFWQQTKYLKTNHPYMGKMNFPEKLEVPARTIVASRFSTSRETMVLKCESGRKGDGEYRLLTVREGATLMSFPLDYRFYGSDSTKWKLLGNAVCPKVSEAIGTEVRKVLKNRAHRPTVTLRLCRFDGFQNLDSDTPKDFSKTPIRKPGARFRRHTFKRGNMTIALANYDLQNNAKSISKWEVFATYGISTRYQVERLDVKIASSLGKVIFAKLGCNDRSYSIVENLDKWIETTVPNCARQFQIRFEIGRDQLDQANPVTVVDKIRQTIDEQIPDEILDVSTISGIKRSEIPICQGITAYLLLQLVKRLKGKLIT